VTLKRAVRYLNIVFLVLAIAAAGAIYWYAWRPLPQTSGTLRAPLSARATVVRDALGVPHISAATVEDALFLQGYVTAQDRLWQMDMLRRMAAGRLSEVVGPSALAMDREARWMRMDRIAQMHAAALSPADRAVFAAYARGVNYFMETHRGRLPVEFTLLGYDPRPWRIEDSILVALRMFRDLTTTWRDKLIKSAMLEGGDPAKIDLLFSYRALQPGSNAWVLAGSRTATGKPLLANDPHLLYSIPGIWHMVYLRAPGLNVAGVALPGVPCVILGHNGRIAWGATNLGYDVQDLYIEKLDRRTGRYFFRGQLEAAHLERELIPVKGAAPVPFEQWVTRHGPVTFDHGRALALRWIAAEPTGFAFPFLDLDRARNWSEFLAALARYPGPAQNFVYADTAGNIGYHAAGALPIRRNYDGDVPVDGSSGNYEWDGTIPFEQLPQTYNPPAGVFVTANDDPFPANYPYRVHGNFAAPFRADRIRALLAARAKWKTWDTLGVQMDIYSSFGQFLARSVVAAYDSRGVPGGEPQTAIALLRSWNGRMERGSAAAFLVTLIYDHLRQAIAERAAPGRAAAYEGPEAAGAAYMMAPAVVEMLLRTRPAGWFSDYDQLLLRSFLDALEQGRRLQGGNLKKWEYGRSIELTLVNPVGSRLPWVGRYFNIGPVEQDGSPVTVKQTSRRLGPSMRTAADLASLDNSYMNIVTGESGQILSSHYKDQWEDYYTGRSFRMQFDTVEAKDKLVFEPEKPVSLN
jgi:penicillin amidase